MDETNLLDMLTSARDNLKRKREEVAEAKKDLSAKETELSKTLRSEFVKLRETLYETETRVLDEAKNEYKQKLTELEAVDGEISKKIQLLSQLQFTEAVKLPIPDVSVDISLADFETAAEKIKAIQIKGRNQSECSDIPFRYSTCNRSIVGKLPAKIGASAVVKLEALLLPNSQSATTSKRVSTNEELSATAAKKKKKKQAAAAAAKRQKSLNSDSDSDSLDVSLGTVVKQEISDVDDDVEETSSTPGEKLQIRSNVRDFIRCPNCRKPRCIYAKKMLSAEQIQEISQWKENMKRIYTCGDSLPPLSRFSNDSVGIEDNVDCHSDVDIHYFYPPRKFPLVCYTCGSDNVASLSEEEKKNYSTYNPVCETCSVAGQRPRTKKKYVRSNQPKKTE